jgi:hypothetical protein
VSGTTAAARSRQELEAAVDALMAMLADALQEAEEERERAETVLPGPNAVQQAVQARQEALHAKFQAEAAERAAAQELAVAQEVVRTMRAEHRRALSALRAEHQRTLAALATPRRRSTSRRTAPAATPTTLRDIAGGLLLEAERVRAQGNHLGAAAYEDAARRVRAGRTT